MKCLFHSNALTIHIFTHRSHLSSIPPPPPPRGVIKIACVSSIAAASPHLRPDVQQGQYIHCCLLHHPNLVKVHARHRVALRGGQILLNACSSASLDGGTNQMSFPFLGPVNSWSLKGDLARISTDLDIIHDNILRIQQKPRLSFILLLEGTLKVIFSFLCLP